MNSLVIVLFLSGMVAMIMLRTLHKDIARYNQMESAVCATFDGTDVSLLTGKQKDQSEPEMLLRR